MGELIINLKICKSSFDTDAKGIMFLNELMLQNIHNDDKTGQDLITLSCFSTYLIVNSNSLARL